MARWSSEDAAFGLAGGCVTVVAAALATAALFAPSQQDARLLAMAVTAGVLAAVLADWRACLGVTLVAALIFVGFLAGHAGDLTSDRSAWPYTLVIGLAALLGRGQRRMRLAQVRRAVH
jgi:hypothetical protein